VESGLAALVIRDQTQGRCVIVGRLRYRNLSNALARMISVTAAALQVQRPPSSAVGHHPI
jgi:hypothetical protein